MSDDVKGSITFSEKELNILGRMITLPWGVLGLPNEIENDRDRQEFIAKLKRMNIEERGT